MYDIYIRNDNTVIVTGGNRIVQGSSMVDTVRVLVPKTYNETIKDMSEFSCMMEYILPCSKKYLVDVLVEDVPNNETVDDVYENYVVYKFDVDSDLTSEPGDIEVQFTFAKAAVVDTYGIEIEPERLRKTKKTKITIVPIAKWSDIMVEMVNSEDPEYHEKPLPVDILDKKLVDINAKYRKKDPDEPEYIPTI